MARLATRLLGLAGWTLLGLAAALGVAISAVAGFAASTFGQPVVARQVVAQLDAAVAGRFLLKGVQVLPQGGLELLGLSVLDPEGRLVLQVDRARLFADLTRLGDQEVGVVLELTHPSVMLETGEDGQLSLVRAFTPAGPAKPAPSDGTAGLTAPNWTLRLTRLSITGADVWWQDAAGETAAEASRLDLTAEGSYGPTGGFLEATLRGEVAAPLAGAVSLDLAASLERQRLTVGVLRASLGETRLEGLGEADLATRRFRAAVTRLGLSRAEAVELVPEAARLSGDLSGTAYAESDGHLLTAALDVRPDGSQADRTAGEARAAAALRLPAETRAFGFDLRVEGLDPSRLLAQAPRGLVNLHGHGAVAGLTPGAKLTDLRGRLDLSVARSTLAAGEFGPVHLRATAEPGRVEVAALEARLPGLVANGQGRWQARGPVGGSLTLTAADLSAFGRNLTGLGLRGLPPLSGRLNASAALSGTAEAPAVKGSVEAPQLAVSGVALTGLSLTAEGSGPLASARGSLSARLGRLTSGGLQVERVQLTAGLAGDEARLAFTAVAPTLGGTALALQGLARLDSDRRGARLQELALTGPGARATLVRPAVLTFDPLRVDRLELADGARRLVFVGGLGPAGALDAQLQLSRIDLKGLPGTVLPASLGLAGEVSLEAEATGTTAAPEVKAHAGWSGGAVRGLEGLELQADLGWSGSQRRASADVLLARAGGGQLSLSADLPVPFTGRARRAEPLSVETNASGWPLEALAKVATADALPADAAAPHLQPVGARLSGLAGFSARLSGTVAAPSLTAGLILEEVRSAGLGPFGLEAALEAPGGQATLTADATLERRPLLQATARLPLSVVDLLLDPAGVAKGLPEAPLTASLELDALDLAAVAGQDGLPEPMAGRLTGEVALTGTARAPRGRASLALEGGVVGAQDGLAGEATLTLAAARTSLVAALTVDGRPALQVAGGLQAPAERLAEPASLRHAPLDLKVQVPGLPLASLDDLGQALGGMITGALTLSGTPAGLSGSLEVAVKEVALEGQPVGELSALAHLTGGLTTAELGIRPAAGGTLWAGGTLQAPLGLDTTADQLLAAPATLKVTSDGLDLGFVPVLARGVVRAASGRLDVALEGAGPLGTLIPRGRLKLTDGRLAISEYGDWTGLQLEASLTERALEVPRLEARRAGGRLTGDLSIRELGSGRAPVAGHVVFKEFAVARAGMVLGTLDFPLELTGTLTPELLDTTLSTTGGTFRLPDTSPRTLQTLERRADIVVGVPKPPRKGGRSLAGPASKPFEARCRVLVPGRFFVKADRPRMNVELKTDSTWRWVDGELRAEGPVEVVKGTVEPISGRIFQIDRGKVTFTGAGFNAAQVDAAARYDNPVAVVTVTVSGGLVDPKVQLSSRPPMDDASIAMLIATGRTEIKAGTSQIDSLTGAEVGMAAANAAVSLAFTSLVQDKLPLDSVSLDASTIRAGKYVTDKLFVGYTRRFEARPEKGENVDEVRVEYQFAPTWRLESRYGNGQSGGASVIWSKDY